MEIGLLIKQKDAEISLCDTTIIHGECGFWGKGERILEMIHPPFF